MKKSFILLAILAVFSASVLLAATAPKGDLKIKKAGSTKKAAVYNHQTHAKIKGADDCNSCHDAVKSKEGAHKLCTPCHRTEKKGPTLCNDCHKN